MSGFATLHPIVNLIYFAFVLLLSLLQSHPLLQGLGLLCAAAYALRCVGKSGFRSQLRMLLPLMLFTAVLNPLLSHEGKTVLFYFPWDAPCTLESLLYGLSTAIRLASVLLIFSAWNAVITTDKFLFLFGRFLPSLALTLCMGLRLVPRLLGRFREVSDVQKCLDPSARGLRHAGRCVSIVVSWALENAIDTADSMKSRGYGLKGRSHFTIYRFTRTDLCCACVLLLLGLGCVLLLSTGAADWKFYPLLCGEWDTATLLCAVCYAIAALFPLIFEAKEALSWRASM